MLRPVLEGERTRGCSCGHVGICSPVPERSSFYTREDGYDYNCKGCHRRKARRYNSDPENRRRHTERQRIQRRNAAPAGALIPEEREVQRAKWRENKRRQLERDPEGTKAKRAKWAKTSEDRRRETMGQATLLELRRIDEACRKERAGKAKLKPLAKVRKTNGRTGRKLSIAPYRAWLRDLLRLEEAKHLAYDECKRDPVERVARILGVSPRTVYKWLHEDDQIDEAVVDRAASRHGGVMAEEIYRSYADAEEVPLGKGAKLSSACKTPGCHDSAAEGKRFCVPCGSRLAVIRGELDDKTKSFRSTIGRKGARPTCCNPACRAPRVKGERFCDRCQEEGWTEEIYDD